jgi:hypothetical protein
MKHHNMHEILRILHVMHHRSSLLLPMCKNLIIYEYNGHLDNYMKVHMEFYHFLGGSSDDYHQ